MATFSQGIELVDILTLDGLTAPAGYTVPAGHYAKINFCLYSIGTGSTFLTVGLFTALKSETGEKITGNLTVSEGLFIGGLVDQPISGSQVTIGIEVYKNP